jgi:multidrug efflux pump subunit AcrA (membrane-fusion protein)
VIDELEESSARAVFVKRAAVVAVCLAAVGGVAFAATRPAKVTYATVVRGAAVRAVYASGAVEPVDRVALKARASGPLAELLVREGDVVQAGQLLARVDVPQLGFDVARGRADLGAAEARLLTAPQIQALQAQRRGLQSELRQARAELDRVQKLAAASAVTEVDVDHARTRVEALSEQIAALEAQQHDARIAMTADAARHRAIVSALSSHASDGDVRAPFHGTILGRHATLGEVVAANQPILKLGDLSQLHVEAEIDEADVARVRPGMPVIVRINGLDDGVFAARVERVLPDADRERKTYEVHATFDKTPEGARSGMSVELNIVLEKHDGALLAPLEAIHDGAAWVIDASDRVRRKSVTVGIRDLATLEITGLGEGDRVVVGDVPLREGDRVKGEPAPPPRPRRQKGPPPSVQ